MLENICALFSFQRTFVVLHLKCNIIIITVFHISVNNIFILFLKIYVCEISSKNIIHDFIVKRKNFFHIIY